MKHSVWLGTVLGVLLALVAGPASAQSGWTDITPPGLGVTPQLIGFDPSNSNRLFMGSMGEGLYATADRGATWTQNLGDFDVPGTLTSCVRDVLLNPKDPARGIAITLSGTYVTWDGGASWVRHPANNQGDSPSIGYAMTPMPDGSGVVATEVGSPVVGGNFWSYFWITDSWQKGNVAFDGYSGQSTTALGFDASKPSRLYVGHTGLKLFWTANLGATLTRCGLGLPAGWAQVVLPDPEEAGRVHASMGNTLYRMTEGKCSWAAVANFPSEIRTAIHNPEAPNLMYLGTASDGVYASQDRGTTWAPMSQAGLPYTSIVDLAIHPGAHRALYATATNSDETSGGIFWRDATPDPPAAPPPGNPGIASSVAPRPGVALSSWPNPFSNTSTISFRLGEPTHVLLEIYDQAGRRIRSLENGTRGAGEHHKMWDRRSDEGTRVPAGVYLLHFETGHGEMKEEKKIVVIP